MSPSLPPHFGQNHAVWGILEPILDTQAGVRDRRGNVTTPPDPARVEAARELLQYLADQGLLFAIAHEVKKAKAARFPHGDMRAYGARKPITATPDPTTTLGELESVLGMCSVRIADFVLYSITRSTIKADVINDNVRPTMGLLTQVAMLGAGQDFDRENRDHLAGTTVLWRRHRYALAWEEELRQLLGYEPSTQELTAYFESHSTTSSMGRTKITVADLDVPPNVALTLDAQVFPNSEDTIGDHVIDDEDAAEARMDAQVAIGLMRRAIRMRFPDSQMLQDQMRRYVNAWIQIRSEPNPPENVSLHAIVKVSGLPRSAAARMALAFDEAILPYVRDSLRPAQAQVHAQRVEAIQTIESQILAWAPKHPQEQHRMRQLTNAWFWHHRSQRPVTVESLAKRLRWSQARTRSMFEAFEEHILPGIEGMA